MKRILFSISHGFQKRMFIDSGLTNMLLDRGHDIYLIVDKDIEMPSYLKKRVNILDGPLFIRPNKVASVYISVRRLFLWRYKLEGSLKNFRNNIKEKKKSLFVPTMIGRILPFEIRVLLDSLIMQNREVDMLLKDVKPDLLVFASGFMYQDAVLNYSAHRLGIKKIMIGQSWDNFSTKTYTLPKPDILVCWGPRMAEEAVTYNDFDPAKINIAGPPHFDIYHRIKKQYSRKEAKKILNLDPEKKLIVFGTSSEIGCPYEYEIAKDVAKLVESSPNEVFKEPLQMVIRLHPMQVVNNEMSMQIIKNLEGEKVKVQIPDVTIKNNNLWELSSSDIEKLGLLIRASDLALNCFSTFSLDAIAFDIPVIITAYDGHHKLKYSRSVRRYLNFIHIKGLLKNGGIRVATNQNELFSFINMYLNNPDLDKDKRQKTLEYELFKVDGKATERIADLISHILK